MSLTVYTNESVPVAVVAGLQRRGVMAISARDSGNLGLDDESQLFFAAENKMVIFTHDDDFLKIAMRWLNASRTHYGVIYVHQDKFGIGEHIRRLKELALLFDPDDFRNHVEFL